MHWSVIFNNVLKHNYMITLCPFFVVSHNQECFFHGVSSGSTLLEMFFFRDSLYILEDFENASPYVCTFLQTVYAIEKLLAGFNVQPRIGMNQSFI